MIFGERLILQKCPNWLTWRPGSNFALYHDVGPTQHGPKKAAEIALEMAWEGCKAVYLSFDIDSIDPGFAPGTGSPEPGGLLPREALEMIHTIAAEGLCGMEVAEVYPPYDVNDNTARLSRYPGRRRHA